MFIAACFYITVFGHSENIVKPLLLANLYDHVITTSIMTTLILQKFADLCKVQKMHKKFSVLHYHKFDNIKPISMQTPHEKKKYRHNATKTQKMSQYVYWEK